MSESITPRRKQGPGNGPSNEPRPGQPASIRIDVPMGTSYQEIQESIFRQAYQAAGTQLRAAIALGITPETVSRVLRRADRRGVSRNEVSEARPLVTDDRAIALPGPRRKDGERASPDRKMPGPELHGATTSMSVGAPDAASPSSDHPQIPGISVKPPEG